MSDARFGGAGRKVLKKNNALKLQG